MVKDIEMIRRFYETLEQKVEAAKELTGKPMTLTEKVLYAHLSEAPKTALRRGEDYAELSPDRVAMQDATAQMALLQFMVAGRKTSVVPATVHTDHLIEACVGAKEDLENANKTNREVYEFLETVCAKYKIGYWKPGAGIIHQILLENYAFPGGLMIGTDSHTPNAGGLSMLAIGVGGADAVDVMSGMSWELKWPKVVGVKLTGRLQGWTSAKDVILKLLGKLTVSGGTGAVLEYFGEGVASLSAPSRATIANMGAELGATASIFPFDAKSEAYLKATGRAEVAEMARRNAEYLTADFGIEKHPENYFDRVIEIDLNKLEPQLNGPDTPDLAWTISKMKDAAKEKEYPAKLSAGLIGSCTEAGYEILNRAAQIAKQYLEHGIKAKSKLYISPGSDMIRATLERDGQLSILREFGATILSNSCGPCIGMWKRTDIAMGVPNSIVTSFNRNFNKRADGNPETRIFISSPALIIALTAAGRIDFDPSRDTLLGSDGQPFSLDPVVREELPGSFATPQIELAETVGDTSGIQVKVDPKSERIQLLTPFAPWDGKDIENVPVLIKVKGKCTTDHISMAGSWLKFRGHLDNISNNLLIGALNAYSGETGKTKNRSTGETQTPPTAARDYQARGMGWIVVGDTNYGEGSSREHAAMEPRYLGGKAIVARSFARIHETNLKKQGMLALTFNELKDYEKILEDDMVSIIGLKDFAPKKLITMKITHKDGTTDLIELRHTYNAAQIEWFQAGGALNLIAKSAQK